MPQLMRTTVLFHKEKNIIYTSLYGFNKHLVFKRLSTRNILEIIFWYNKNIIIIITL